MLTVMHASRESAEKPMQEYYSWRPGRHPTIQGQLVLVGSGGKKESETHQKNHGPSLFNPAFGDGILYERLSKMPS